MLKLVRCDFKCVSMIQCLFSLSFFHGEGLQVQLFPNYHNNDGVPVHFLMNKRIKNEIAKFQK